MCIRDRYEGIAKWHKKLGEEAMRMEKITTPSGRQYAFPDVVRKGEDKFSHFTMIKNYPVQGFATGDIVPIVLLEIDKALSPLQSCLVNTVHDSVVIDVHPLEEHKVILLLKGINDNLKNIIESYFDIDLVVPMLLEAKIGNNWLDTKDVP